MNSASDGLVLTDSSYDSFKNHYCKRKETLAYYCITLYKDGILCRADERINDGHLC